MVFGQYRPTACGRITILLHFNSMKRLWIPLEAYSMGVRNPEPVVIDWSFRPAVRISVVTSSIIRWSANSSARLFRPNLSCVGGGEVAFAADRVTMPGIPQKEPHLWIRASTTKKDSSVDCSSTAFRFVLSITPKPCFFSAAAT